MAMQLHRGEAGDACSFLNLFDGLVDEDTHFFDGRRQLGGDFLRGFSGDITRASRIEDEAKRAGAGIDGGERVVEVRDAADLDLGHKGSFELRATSFEPSSSTADCCNNC